MSEPVNAYVIIVAGTCIWVKGGVNEASSWNTIYNCGASKEYIGSSKSGIQICVAITLSLIHMNTPLTAADAAQCQRHPIIQGAIVQ
jgi:hypothetical protein